ncbi:Hypothetical predicted protein [Mytilus galloprovincialis]|uniref:Short-chain collagen C4 n=1 Tax=Mytilus galloprovincialis TaxID=29158 RepID=A0A8B6BHC8_MYTGA|nr:Hypothetical predicted protein [Mytilus galloprovincialis]
MTNMFEILLVILFVDVDLIFAEHSRTDNDYTKRLLLSDPDVINSRLVEMERMYQLLKREMIDMNTTLSTALSEEKAKTENLQRTLQKGFTAGQLQEGPTLSSRYGGPSNILCLPNNPETSNITTVGRSLIYGTEYEETFFGAGAADEDAPCAVCRSHYTYASIMIPGRKSCYSGWKLEYHGYLASNHYGYKASSYICVDNKPEFLQGGKSNQNGNLLFATATKCGSLPCPPYDDNFAVYCVVCSK